MFRLFLVFIFFQAGAVQAVLLSEMNPFDAEVLFTNPKCPSVEYKYPVKKNRGGYDTHSKENVFCVDDREKTLSKKNGMRQNSPQQRLVDWIRAEDTKEIYMAYLSFSDKRIQHEICDAMKSKNLILHLVLDSSRKQKAAEFLSRCDAEANPEQQNFFFYPRGNIPGMGYAHVKLFVVNPSAQSSGVQLAVSSGNMSSGTHMHHENWIFFNVNRFSHFYQKHICLMENMIDSNSRRARFKKDLLNCISKIRAPEEADIRARFTPGEELAARDFIIDNIEKHDSIKMAAHRFSHKEILGALSNKLGKNPKAVKLLVDDDLYWGTKKQHLDPLTKGEVRRFEALRAMGLKARFMQTNHRKKLLHHNKFIVFETKGEPSLVFMGAGNFTKAAFSKNLENYYLIELASVTKRYKRQFNYMYGKLATSWSSMPVKLPQIK
ncbi:MAG: phospholipase D-like domain-containing protein [Bdellovibrionales bacterium]